MTAAGLAGDDQRRVLLAFVALGAGAVAVSTSGIFVRLADVGPYASAFWRTFLALPFLWLWMRWEERGAPRGLAFGLAFDRPIVLAGLLFAGDLFFWHLSIFGTTIANATFLATTAPIWVALGAWLVLSERIGRRTLAGLALCLAGGFALLGESYGFAPERLRGDIFGLVTAMFFGAYVLAVRSGRARHGAAALMFYSTAITAACLLVIAAIFDTHLLPRSWSGFSALLALALVSQVGGQGLISVALGTLPATFSSLVIFIEAIAAAALGWAVLNEALGWAQALGGLFILLGIWIARPRPGPTPAGGAL